MSTYTGTRIVPKHCGVWDKTKEYETLSIVLYEDTGDSYTSRKAVPKGIDISDEEYWALSAKFSADVGELAEQLQSFIDEAEPYKEKLDGIEENATANVGTITGVTASSPLTGGGTSGKVTVGLEYFSNTNGTYGNSSDLTPGFGESFKTLYEAIDKYGRANIIREYYVTIPDTEASTTEAGLMSAEDKAKLDSLSEGSGGGMSSTDDTKDNTVTFTSKDGSSPTSWTSVDVIKSGETHSSLFSKISAMVKNVRYLFKILGSTDISSIGDGTVTDILSTLKSSVDTNTSDISTLSDSQDNKKIYTYTDPTQFGSSTSASLTSLYSALPNKSEFIYDCANLTDSSWDFPNTYSMLQIIKMNSTRSAILLWGKEHTNGDYRMYTDDEGVPAGDWYEMPVFEENNLSGKYALISATMVSLNGGSIDDGKTAEVSVNYTVSSEAHMTIAVTSYANYCTVNSLSAGDGTVTATLMNVSGGTRSCSAVVYVLQFMRIK